MADDIQIIPRLFVHLRSFALAHSDLGSAPETVPMNNVRYNIASGALSTAPSPA